MSTDRDEAVLRAARHAAASQPTEAPSDTAVVAAGLTGAVEVMDRLWNFGGWEVTQTHDSLRPYLLEETYELLDAIQHNDAETIKEELGDLLLQVLFHSRIAQAAGEFTVDDVAAALVAKLVNRSPYLRDADFAADTSLEEKIAAQESAWEERKSAEKSRRSCLDGIAMAQPALALAEKIRDRSTKAGLPADLIPEDLRTVHLGGPDSAEERLRKATLAFAATIHATEDAAETARGERRPLTSDDWYKYWTADA
ncbi:MazG family protein [Nocardia suismassiliense]|uniref:MazG family protein n=1 Tax=Nocardia suismassiliense TaxID=2077092 RepID=UPI000D1E1E94